jgi:hypothetical protein
MNAHQLGMRSITQFLARLTEEPAVEAGHEADAARDQSRGGTVAAPPSTGTANLAPLPHAELKSRSRTDDHPARTASPSQRHLPQPSFRPAEYGSIEYSGLPVNYSVFI